MCVLEFLGANPTLRDYGRGFRADQWARFCGRYTCSDVIEKHTGRSNLEKSMTYETWSVDGDIGSRILLGKAAPVSQASTQSFYGEKNLS